MAPCTLDTNLSTLLYVSRVVGAAWNVTRKYMMQEVRIKIFIIHPEMRVSTKLSAPACRHSSITNVIRRPSTECFSSPKKTLRRLRKVQEFSLGLTDSQECQTFIRPPGTLRFDSGGLAGSWRRNRDQH